MLSSRELSGGCQTRQVRGALPRRPPPRPGRPTPHRSRVGRKVAGEGECGELEGWGLGRGRADNLESFLGRWGGGGGVVPARATVGV